MKRNFFGVIKGRYESKYEKSYFRRVSPSQKKGMYLSLPYKFKNLRYNQRNKRSRGGGGIIILSHIMFIQHTMIHKSQKVIFCIKVVQSCFIWGYHNLQRQFMIRFLDKLKVLYQKEIMLLNIG